MLRNKALALPILNIESICAYTHSEIFSIFGDSIKKLKVKHSIKAGVLSVKVHFKRNGLSDIRFKTMLDFLKVYLKTKNLVPDDFTIIVSHEETKFTSDITLVIKGSD